jgi:uncharacterized protein YciI
MNKCIFLVSSFLSVIALNHGNSQNAPLKETLYCIRFSPGESYNHFKTIYQQDLLEHARYMQHLFEQGILVMAGPFEDSSGGQLIIKVEDERQAKFILENDPAFKNKIFKATITPWHITFKAINLDEKHLKKKLE